MKKIWVRVLLVFIALGVVDKLILPFYTSSGHETVVPDVRNMTYGKAEGKLRWSGLQARKSFNVRYLANVPADVVIDQIPAAGMKVKPGRNVYLVLNRQEKPSYPIPDLSGRPEDDARQVLARLGMVVTDVQLQAVSNPDQDGRVLSQSVPPNVPVKTGSEVSLVVGKLEMDAGGPRRVVMPEVLGMSVDQARSVLIQNGLKVGKVSYEYSSVLVPNTVISQKPAVNSFVPAGQQVDLTAVTGEQR